MPKIVPMDIGFSWTKACVLGGGLFIQPTVAGSINEEVHAEDIKPMDLVYDECLHVGDFALRHSDVKYFTFAGDKSNAWTTEVLLDTALGCLIGDGTANIVSGLPVDYYFSQKKQFEEMFLLRNGGGSPYSVSCGHRRFSVNPRVEKVKIVPQPMGAAMDFLLDDSGKLSDVNKDVARKRIIVSDWGRYTWDVLIIEGMAVHPKSFSRDDMGIEVVYKLLQRYLRSMVGKSPASHDMDSVVLKGEYEGYNITPLINKAFHAVLSQMQLEIDGLNMKFAKSILAGGQAERQNQFLQLPDKVVGGQLSNVNGYGKIGVRTWGVES